MNVVSTAQQEPNFGAVENANPPTREDLSTRAVLEDLGYAFVSAAELKAERYDMSEPVLFDRLTAAVKRLNRGLSREIAAQAATLFATSEREVIAANERNHRLLHGIEMERDAARTGDA